jgi:hypothetical protein
VFIKERRRERGRRRHARAAPTKEKNKSKAGRAASATWLIVKEEGMERETHEQRGREGGEGNRERATSAIASASMHRAQEQEPAGDAPQTQKRTRER